MFWHRGPRPLGVAPVRREDGAQAQRRRPAPERHGGAQGAARRQGHQGRALQAEAAAGGGEEQGQGGRGRECQAGRVRVGGGRRVK